MNTDDITLFAETNFRNQKRKFGIKPDDRRRHFYVVGKTGMGKSTLLETMAIADINAGRGVGIIDPHGDLAEKLLDYIPEHRINDVVYFNPADDQYPVAFNPLEKVGEEARHMIVSGLMGVFKKIWIDAWSARMEYILNNTLLAILEYPDQTLLGVLQMFSNKDYRKKIVDNLKDPVVKSFWVNEYAKYSQKFETEAVAPLQNKVGQFVSNPLIRNILGQQHSAINLRKIMDEGKILIANLSKGRIGEDNSALLGSMLITRIQLAAMSRVDIPEKDRRDFLLSVDEFQNFATSSFASILSEARKYRLCLTIAHQYIGQLEQGDNSAVRDAVFGNVGTMLVFRVGAEDAEALEKEFEPEFMVNDFVNLPRGNVYLKLMVNGVTSRPFSATVLLTPPKPEISYAKQIIENSRRLYATKYDEVNAKITKELFEAEGGAERETGWQRDKMAYGGGAAAPRETTGSTSVRGEHAPRPAFRPTGRPAERPDRPRAPRYEEKRPERPERPERPKANPESLRSSLSEILRKKENPPEEKPKE